MGLLGAWASLLVGRQDRGWAVFASIVVSVAFICVTVQRIPQPRRPAFQLIMAGCWIWGLGWGVFTYFRQNSPELSPSPGDVLLILAYLPLTAGVLRLNRERGSRPAFGALLDASIVTASAAVLALVFVVMPLAGDSDASLLARLFGSIYPLLDVLLLFLIARTLLVPRERGPVQWWLALAIGTTLTADIVENVIDLQGGGSLPGWLFVLWASFFPLIGVAADRAGAQVETPSGPGAEVAQEAAGLTVPRLLLLAAAAGLPSVVLLRVILDGGSSYGPSLCVGSLVLLGMVLARIWSLLRVLDRQAEQLSRAARTDPLTGVANRRSWDFELARAMARSRENGTVLMVGLLDLDHFKKYNDQHGHQAGDDLLREAARGWDLDLATDGRVARWGGEEFAVLLHCDDQEAGARRLDGLRAAVPFGQTCSMGIICWNGTEDPDSLLRLADGALYQAKHLGRNRTIQATVTSAEAESPSVPILSSSGESGRRS